MDMPHLSFTLSFAGQIRKIPVPDLPIVILSSPASKHKLWHVLSYFHDYM